MNSKFIIIGIIGVALLMVGYGLYYELQEEPTSNNSTFETVQSGTPVGGGVLGENVPSAATIRRTDSGYEPEEITIREGETVSFINESSDFHWPASDVHPTHQIYSDFDPREPIAPGEIWSFTFTKAGEWKLHDHLRANFRGTITVLPNEQ